MGRHRVHNGLRTGAAINLGTFGPDPKADMAGFKREDEAAYNDNPLGNNIAAMAQVQDKRNADMLAGNPTRMLGGPAPDSAWDAFFGSLQQKQARANEHGLRFGVNLAGNGPGEGIGQLASRNAEGLTEHPLAGLGAHPSIEGLQGAAQRINMNAANVYQAKRNPIVAPHGTDALFGDPRAQQQADSRYSALQAANKRRY